MQNALIIFIRNPELGKVKTRLSATIGPVSALTVYMELLQHTFKISSENNADKFVYYSDSVTENDLWNAPGFAKKIQASGTLGVKMNSAFTDLFALGYKKIMIIGSDCFELTAEIIGEAFKRLDDHDVVIGPANDGGYYLLGLKKMLGYIFRNKSWSTDCLYEETIADLRRNDNSFYSLIKLTDVDTEEDWINTRK